ncbi:TPA: hypothetical protein ACIHD8_005010, partial [Salmonella enterica subsp. enterica serovar Typhimurium]
LLIFLQLLQSQQPSEGSRILTFDKLQALKPKTLSQFTASYSYFSVYYQQYFLMYAFSKQLFDANAAASMVRNSGQVEGWIILG